MNRSINFIFYECLNYLGGYQLRNDGIANKGRVFILWAMRNKCVHWVDKQPKDNSRFIKLVLKQIPTLLEQYADLTPEAILKAVMDEEYALVDAAPKNAFKEYETIQVPAFGTPCPKCGSTVEVKHNKSDFKPFYGCTGFPACKFTASVPGVPNLSFNSIYRKTKTA